MEAGRPRDRRTKRRRTAPRPPVRQRRRCTGWTSTTWSRSRPPERDGMRRSQARASPAGGSPRRARRARRRRHPPRRRSQRRLCPALGDRPLRGSRPHRTGAAKMPWAAVRVGTTPTTRPSRNGRTSIRSRTSTQSLATPHREFVVQPRNSRPTTPPRCPHGKPMVARCSEAPITARANAHCASTDANATVCLATSRKEPMRLSRRKPPRPTTLARQRLRK